MPSQVVFKFLVSAIFSKPSVARTRKRKYQNSYKGKVLGKKKITKSFQVTTNAKLQPNRVNGVKLW